MKKIFKTVILPLLIACLLGLAGAKITYSFYKIKKDITETEFNAYAVQYGVYTSPKTLEKTLKNLSNYVVTQEDGKYYIYLGFTTNYNNLSKIKRIYEDQNIDVYTKKIYIDNEEFVTNLEQYDVLLDNVINEEDVVMVNQAILSTYDEIILGK